MPENQWHIQFVKIPFQSKNSPFIGLKKKVIKIKPSCESYKVKKMILHLVFENFLKKFWIFLKYKRWLFGKLII